MICNLTPFALVTGLCTSGFEPKEDPTGFREAFYSMAELKSFGLSNSIGNVAMFSSNQKEEYPDLPISCGLLVFLSQYV